MVETAGLLPVLEVPLLRDRIGTAGGIRSDPEAVLIDIPDSGCHDLSCRVGKQLEGAWRNLEVRRCEKRRAWPSAIGIQKLLHFQLPAHVHQADLLGSQGVWGVISAHRGTQASQQGKGTQGGGRRTFLKPWLDGRVGGRASEMM